ncbi:hypothetical protein JKF63_07819 [Porcisia hertigi]|uniref:Dymeclin n=1 Tax=Porcisia hertigi TaxID=2761500 RepID=A0A836YK28_9TRYP|nr:hypothetical protein JKF63_07819 [Porcisia hertigi]
MGATLRKEASEYFTVALTSDAAASPDESEFLAKTKQYERSICGGAELYGVAEPIAAAVMSKAPETGRVRWLLRLCSAVMQRSIEAPHDLDATTPAVVHISEVLLRHILRLTNGNSASLVAVVEAPGRQGEMSPSNDTVCENVTAMLCCAAMSFLVRVPLNETTIVTHLEVLRLLLTMTSSALHHGTDFREDMMDLFTELIMSSPLLGECLPRLLHIIVLWKSQNWAAHAPLLYHEGYQPSFLNLFNAFSTNGVPALRSRTDTYAYVLDVQDLVTTTATASSTASSSGGTNTLITGTLPKNPAAVLVKSCSCWEQAFRHATALLCVLVVHQRGSGRNPALEYVSAMRDGSPVSFVDLLSVIRWRLVSFPEISILLYVLLHDHPEFLHTVLTKDAALFVSTLQQLLELTRRTCKDTTRLSVAAAAAAGTVDDVLQNAVLGRIIFQQRIFSYPFINFISSTLLLLVSQDRVINRLLCDTPCVPSNALERHVDGVSVGALAVVVLSLGIMRGLNECNEALIAVFAPCLVNLAPFVHDMDSYTAQRVSALLALSLKKIHRASALLGPFREAAAAPTSTTEGDTGGPNIPVEDGNTPAVAPSHGGGSSFHPAHGKAPTVALTTEDAQALEEVLAMYLRQLHTIIEGVEALLRGADRRNERLIYELLYIRERLIDDVDSAVEKKYLHAHLTKQLLANVAEMIRNCEADIASTSHAESPQDILTILLRGQQQQQQQQGHSHGSNMGSAGSGGSSSGGNCTDVSPSKGGGLVRETGVSATATADAMGRSNDATVDLVYSYEESPHSYDFFGPFVWATLLSAGQLPGGALWCRHSSELSLFPH